MTEARSGDIWSVDLGTPVGREQGYRRPALVVSSTRWNRHATKVTLLPLTRTKRGGRTRLEIEPRPGNGLSATSYAGCEDIRSVSVLRLGRRLGRVGLEEMHAVRRTLRLLLDL